MKIRVAWLAPYPVLALELELKTARKVAYFHPCSWIVNLSTELAKRNDIELHLVTQSPLVPYSQIVKINNITFHALKNGVLFTNKCLLKCCAK